MKKIWLLFILTICGFVANAQTRLFYVKTLTDGVATPLSYKSLLQSDIPNLVSDLAGKVPSTRTITINGVTYDLSANRSWTISGSGGTWGSITGDIIDQVDLDSALGTKLKISDTATMLSPYALDLDLANYGGLSSNNTWTGSNHFQPTGTGERVTITEMSGSTNIPLYITYNGAGKGLQLGWRSIDFPTDNNSAITFANQGGIYSQGLTISKNLTGSVAAVNINQQQGTGNILDLKYGGSILSYFDKDGILVAAGISTSTVSTTEFGYLDGVTSAIQTQFTGKVNTSDTSTMLTPYLRKADTASMLTPYTTQAEARSAISLTTTGTSGAATYNSSTGVLNIPQYSSGSVTLDATPTDGSTNGVESNGVFDALALKANLASPVFTGVTYAARSAVGISSGIPSNTLFYLENNSATANNITFWASGQSTASSGITSVFSFTPHFNQSGTAGDNVIYISPYYQAVGSGSHYLIRAGTNTAANSGGTHTDKFTVDRDGNLVLAGDLSTASVSSTEFNYLDGVTSAIQTQINGKAATSHTHAQSDITNLTSDLALKAPLASPTFTGTVAASTVSTTGKLTVTLTSAQQRWAYDGSNYIEISVASNGATTIDATGAGAKVTFNDQINAANGIQVFGSTIFTTDVDTAQWGTGGSIAKNEMIDPLEIATTSTQLRLNYSSSNLTTFTTGSSGDMTVVPSGGDLFLTGNLDVSGTVKVGSMSGVATAMDSAVVLNRTTGLLEVRKVSAGGTIDATPTNGSTNAVSSDGVFDALALKANLASPALTGTPTAPTAAVGTNTTQIATTAFVQENKTQRVVLASDQANSNTNGVWEDVTGLSFPVTANKTYKFKFVISFDAALQTTGSKWAINGPTLTRTTYKQANSLTITTQFFNENNGYDQGSTASSSAFATGNICIIEGVIRCSAGGTVVARHATEVTGSAITAKAGYSYVEYEQLD